MASSAGTGLSKLNALRAEARKRDIEWRGYKMPELEAMIRDHDEMRTVERANRRCSKCGEPDTRDHDCFDDVDPDIEGDGIQPSETIDVTSDLTGGWLYRAMRELAPLCRQVGAPVDISKLSASVGYGSHGRSLGMCRPPHLFVKPTETDPVRVLASLAHGMIHAGTNTTSHPGPFTRSARSMGLIGGGPHHRQWGMAEAGPELIEALTEIASELGPYPHKPIEAAPKQPTLMRKVWCEHCGFIMRTSDRWINTFTSFACPCGKGSMRIER